MGKPLRWLWIPCLVAIDVLLIVKGHPWLALVASGGPILVLLFAGALLFHRRFFAKDP